MSWGRLDDQANGNAKLLALSDTAWRMWGCGLIYCQANLTDGFIPTHAVQAFGVRGNKKRAIDELCAVLIPGKASLWEPVKDGYRVHDYLTWNSSRETVERDRAKSKDRFDAWKKKRDCNTGSNGVASPVETPVQQVSTPTTTTDRSKDQERSVRTRAHDALPERAGTFCEWYGDTYRRLLGVGYIGNPRKDYEAALLLCEKLSDQEIRDTAIVWFGADDDFARQGTRSIPKFASRATGYLEQLKARGIA